MAEETETKLPAMQGLAKFRTPDNDMIAKLGQNASALGGMPPGVSRGTTYLSFNGTTGEFTLGRNNDPLPEDQQFVAPVSDYTHGWKYWDNRKVTDTTIVSAFEDFPAKPDNRPEQSNNSRTGWAREFGMSLSAVGGPLDGRVLQFTGSSKGFSDMWADLLAAVSANFVTNPDAKEKGCVHPLFTMFADSYIHPEYDRRVFVPRVNLIGFTNGEDTAPAAPAKAVETEDVLD